ncbi:MAG: hypothetical protein ACI9BW_004255 [Gammaproteobacteria bacterium]|jgi:hypothetical protein
MTDGPGKRIIEAVGFLGVVGSLIFVGLEVRQNSIAIRSETNASVAQAFQTHNMMMASVPELAAAWSRNAVSPETASPEDAFQLAALWRSLFHVWSNAHRQHLNGTLDPSIYASVVQEVTLYAGASRPSGSDESVAIWAGDATLTRHFLWAWKGNRYAFNPEFRSFIDGIIDGNHEVIGPAK